MHTNLRRTSCAPLRILVPVPEEMWGAEFPRGNHYRAVWRLEDCTWHAATGHLLVDLVKKRPQSPY